MELDWSEQSPHIRSLYRPWQPGDEYGEAILQAARRHVLGRGLQGRYTRMCAAPNLMLNMAAM